MASTSQTAAVRHATTFTGRGGLVDRYFYFAMGLLAAALVAAGFSQTVNGNLLHAAVPRPMILWLHAATFSGWVLFYIFQSALVRTRNVKVHRTLGWFGAALGAVMVPLGVATTVVMSRFRAHVLHDPVVSVFMIIPIYDMVVFGTLITLAIQWRRKPDLHRRLLFIATAGLLSAAFGRLPHLFDMNLFIVCIDSVMALGMVRDLIVDRRIHKVYLVAMPCLIALQCFAIHTFRTAPPWWVAIVRSIVG
jgi:hypothetical protein